MLIANIPVIFAGKWLMQRIPLKLAHRCAFALFIALAILTMAKAYFD
jgi:putative Ca2+/H+ antiporter (TMEM165/GDT1 family)